jgi:hypothetical protein
LVSATITPRYSLSSYFFGLPIGLQPAPAVTEKEHPCQLGETMTACRTPGTIDMSVEAQLPRRNNLGWLQVVGIVVPAVVLLAIIVLPLVGVSRHIILKENPIKIQDYGAWLSGALTPALIIIAFVGYLAQRRGQEETLQAHHEANLVQLQNQMLSNLHEVYGRVNYLAACVIGDARPHLGTVRHGDLQEVSRLTALLLGKADEPNPLIESVPLDIMVNSDYFKQLMASLQKTVAMIRGSHFEFKAYP